MKVLNLYAGLGGNRKLWKDVEVTAIEYSDEIASLYKKNFKKDTVIVCDAHEYLLQHYKEFDFIWSSPPCPSHSKIRQSGVYQGQNEAVYPDMRLYQEILLLKYFAKKETKWVVENVKPYYPFLIPPQVELGRHLFWANFYVKKIDFVDDNDKIDSIQGNKDRYGFSIKDEKMKSRKDQILRNLVKPEIGLYLFEQSQKGKPPLFNFNY